jgi:hypothetical protein
MKMILKSAIAVAALAGATVSMSSPAFAGVDVSVGIGIPGAIYGPGYSAYDDQYYYEPIYIGGYWYHGPYRWQMRHGQRMFFVDGRWRHDEWRGGARPNSITFRNGGSFRDGRNIGFRDADRVNARFRSGGSDVRQDRRELNSDKREIREDRRDLRDDKRDRKEDRRDDRHDDHSRN